MSAPGVVTVADRTPVGVSTSAPCDDTDGTLVSAAAASAAILGAPTLFCYECVGGWAASARARVRSQGA